MLWFEDILRVVLGSFRIGGLLLAMPIFGTNPTPPLLRFFLAITLAVMMTPFQPPLSSVLWEKNGLLFLVLARELGLGLFMGFLIRFFFLVISMALEFVGLQMGFSIANVFDPQNNSQVSVVAQLGVTLAIILFFVANLHHDVFRILVKSYDWFPVGLPDWKVGAFFSELMFFLNRSFELSLRLASPVLVAMLVIHVFMGIVSKTAPQMNLFINAAFSINIVTGLLIVVLIFPRLFLVAQNFFNLLYQHGFGLR